MGLFIAGLFMMVLWAFKIVACIFLAIIPISLIIIIFNLIKYRQIIAPDQGRKK